MEASIESHKFTCMFDQCNREFDTLRAFKMHITEGHQEEDQISARAARAKRRGKEENGGSGSPTVITKEMDVDTDGEDDNDADKAAKKGTNAKHLDAAEKSALNGLLKLCEMTKDDAEGEQSGPVPEVLTIHQTPSTTQQMINNIPVIPLLSPTGDKIIRKSPKTKKYPTAIPVVLQENESSAKFYDTKGMSGSASTPQIVNVSTIPMESAHIHEMSRQNVRGNKRNKLSGKKRKISEMDSDQLAHLCLKLQDKISALDSQLQTAHKQLSVVRTVYRKKSKSGRKHR